MTCVAGNLYPPERRASPEDIPQFSAFGQTLRPGGAVNGTVTPPPSSEAFVALTNAAIFKRVISPVVSRRRPLMSADKVIVRAF